MFALNPKKQESSALKKSKTPTFILLFILVSFYSLASVCSKTASQQAWFSLEFFFWYGCVLVILGIYALGWQQVLKRIELTTAYSAKASTIVWGFLWGALLFNEQISITMYIGAAIVFAGIILVVTSHE